MIRYAPFLGQVTLIGQTVLPPMPSEQPEPDPITKEWYKVYGQVKDAWNRLPNSTPETIKSKFLDRTLACERPALARGGRYISFRQEEVDCLKKVLVDIEALAPPPSDSSPVSPWPWIIGGAVVLGTAAFIATGGFSRKRNWIGILNL